MFYAGGMVLSKNLTLCPATSHSYLSSFNRSCIESNPDMSGIWCVANAW
jgi:hypothetical protein